LSSLKHQIQDFGEGFTFQLVPVSDCDTTENAIHRIHSWNITSEHSNSIFGKTICV